jgi:hypothetical protein
MSTPHIQKVKEELINLFKENKYDVKTVAFGQKKVNKTFLEEKSICFGVEKKLPLSEIPPEKLIPPSITIDGVTYKTDVYIVSGEIYTAQLKSKMILDSAELKEPVSPAIGYTNGTGSTMYIGYSQPHTDCQVWRYANYTFETKTFNVVRCHNWSTTVVIPPATMGFDVFDSSWDGPSSDPSNPTVDGINIVFQKDPSIFGSSYAEDFWFCCSPGQNEYTVGSANQLNADSRVATIRTQTRPMKGALSIGPTPYDGYVAVGTLGAIVVDSTDGKMVALTNNHVCAEPYPANSLPRFMASDPAYSTYYEDYNNIEMYQPSAYDSGVINPSHKIGKTKRSYPYTSTDTNYIDAGLINLSSSFLDTNSWDVVGSSFSAAPPFASTAEIDAITTSTEIFKSGRTMGPIGMDISDMVASNPCKLVVTSTSTAFSLYVSDTIIINYADCIQIQSAYPSNIMAGLPGDSGSVLYAKIGGVWKVIGLFFAGNIPTGVNYATYTPIGYACRIDRVASMLKIQAYTGGTVDANPNTPTYTKLSGASYGNQASVEIGGKTYWQVGIYGGGTYPPA